MVSVDIRLNSQKDMTEFVNRCERAFEARLDDVAKQVVSDKELHIIALSGPTCSGKTICANKLIYELEAAGKNIHLISIDDFFKEREQFPILLYAFRGKLRHGAAVIRSLLEFGLFIVFCGKESICKRRECHIADMQFFQYAEKGFMPTRHHGIAVLDCRYRADRMGSAQIFFVCL